MFHLALIYTNNGYADLPEPWPTWARAEALRLLRADADLDQVHVYQPRTGPGVYVGRGEV